MANLARHPNKEIRKAIEYAVEHGWRLVQTGPRAHAWGRLMCTHQQRGGCIISVWSTPGNPEALARRICRLVDNCPHTEV